MIIILYVFTLLYTLLLILSYFCEVKKYAEWQLIDENRFIYFNHYTFFTTIVACTFISPKRHVIDRQTDRDSKRDIGHQGILCLTENQEEKTRRRITFYYKHWRSCP